MFLTMFYKKQNIVLTMPQTMLIAHPSVPDPLYSMKILVGKSNDKLDYYTTNPMLV